MSNDKPLKQRFWGKDNVLLNFKIPSSGLYRWTEGLRDLLKEVQFDGLYCDKNEITGDCDGECTDDKISSQKTNFQTFLSAEEERHQRVNHSWWYSYPDQSEINSEFLPFVPGK